MISRRRSPKHTTLPVPVTLLAGLLLLSSARFANPQFTTARNIYPDPSSAHEDLQAALTRARREHKRILVDFGADWCGDCHVLDLYFAQPANAALLARYFLKVEVNVGHYDANGDLAQRFGIPLRLGVPAIAVLDTDGKLLYAQRNKEFEHMGQLQPGDLTAFLEHWRPRTSSPVR